MNKENPNEYVKKISEVLDDKIKIITSIQYYYDLESQEDFADKLGTTPTYVSNLENAKRNTRIDYIDQF